ncbi:MULTISPECIES: hypothetical protein [Clostridium]|uniref:Uncharacterized protein n=1 Tax=Clostridium botulinum D str. 1873 TaxID=592027 RepID=A0A9N7AQR5_CLOBO|nr:MULTISPECIES: hypothetical protein [Clostridium]ACT33720.1 conserved hypothetical protein [Clostridium botulinum D str. 1873]AYF55401.1 hypothetical protein DFH04_11760 [Clostridium novyi]MBO3442136.1 serine protease [Clostridium haemolyticum]QPW56699.1 serine protease [Clostridium botulinum]
MCNSISLEKKILHIARCNYDYFLNKANVVGVGLGYKIKNGFNTFQKCLSVFVINKLPSCNMSSNDMIPSYYSGIPTDVVNTGAFHFQKLNKKIRPVSGGYDIGPALIRQGGTLGCVVTDDKFLYILTCNHIITFEESLPLNYSITQPSYAYGGDPPKDTIATLSKYVPISYSTSTNEGINYVDCAIAKILNPSEVSSKITFLGNIKGLAKPSLGLYVQKVGVTSELTSGTITSIGTAIKINGLQGESIFLDQITTSKMGDPGDSGSILLNRNKQAIGMFMSGNSTRSTFNPIETVLSNINVKLITR